MSEKLTLFTLLGATTVTEAARRWPRTTFLPGLGLSGTPEDVEDYEPLLDYLNAVLTFAAVRPGAAADRVGLTAEVAVTAQPNPVPLVLRELPDVGFVLQPMVPARPARLFVTRSDAGVEVVVEGLAVEIVLPDGLLAPLYPEDDELGGVNLLDVEQAGPFEPGAHDTFRVVLRELTGSSIFVHLRVRLTEEGEVVVEPAVPVSLAECRFSGLPCDAVHDLGLLPYPTLSGPHTEHEQALEWRRHDIPGGLGSEGRGLITVRTLDLDHTRDPIKQLVQRFVDDDARAGVEFVLEDLALPVSSWLTPVATHGRFGLRRSVIQGGDEVEAYDLSQAPVEIDLSPVVGWRLKIFRLLFESPSTVVARMAVLLGDTEDSDQAVEIDVGDGWLLQGAWVPPHPVRAFTIANAHLSLMTARLGFLLRDLGEAQGVGGWFDHVRALFDAGIAVGDGKDETVQLQVPAKPPGSDPPSDPPGSDLGQDLVLRNLGWDLGSPAILPSLWFPETVKLTAFEVVQLDVEEIAFLSEDNGGRYLAFSGGVSIFPGAGDAERKPREPGTPGVPAESSPNGGGIRFRRLRFRIGGNPQAPRWLLDGITLFIKIGTFELSGFGTITDTTHDGHRFREFGLGLLLRFQAMGKEFGIGAQLCYGRVSGPTDNFTYWLFGLQLSYCPVGTFELRGIRLLVAGGMAPDLPEPSGRPQEMRLLVWYQQNSASGAVTVRSDRSQQRGGWKVERDAEAAGVGADLCLSVSKALILRAFIFFHRGDSGSGLLVAAEVFALKASRPIGVGAIEVDLDRDKWSAIIGVDLDLASLLATDSPLAKGLGRLTGTIFAGNQPGMFAIGQLADQSSWLTLAVNKSVLGLQARVSLAFCLQVAGGDGPRGFGIAVTAAAQGSVGIGKVQLYAALSLLAGVWGNEASSSGFVALAEIGLRIKVFWVFSFGATVRGTFEQLGPQEPNFRRFSLIVRIETPWWLPDVTFRMERVRNSPQPEEMPVVSPPLAGAAALEPGAATETVVATDAAPSGSVLSIAALRALPAGPLAESVWTDLVPVSVDATVALDFAVPVGNETTVVPSAGVGAGRQQATPPAQNQLAATYALTSVGIRRRARYGPDAGVWTDLLAPADSAVGSLDDLIDDTDLGVTFASTVRFRWDADVVADDAVDPRRLLVNADTPYSFLTGNPATEEGLLATDPAFPCCAGTRKPVTHRLDFVGRPVGVRTPVVLPFTASTSTLRWLLHRPPVVALASGPPVGTPVARVLVPDAESRAISVVTFDEPAFLVELTVFWTPPHAANVATVVVEAVRGLGVVAREAFSMATASPTVPIRLQDRAGFTSLTLRVVREALGTTDVSPDTWLELRQVRYQTVREERDRLADQGRCQAQGGVAGGGKLAWLPNHDYELTLAVRTTVEHQGSGQQARIEQRAGFRTRGLPGLNAVEAPGTELEPYVESVYPGATRLLYRAEPLMLAFDERFSTLLPVDRTPAPGDPAERTQLLEWVLAVEQGDGQRLSVPSADWIVTHRGTVPPPRPFPRVIDDVLVARSVRRAPSVTPLVVRLEALEQLSPACTTDGVRLHSSQVLTHAPVGATAIGGDPGTSLWPARTTLRAAVRGKAGPYVARRPFADGDETALTVANEGQLGATAWHVVDGSAAVIGPADSGLRHYGVFGDAGWNHLQVHVEVDPAGGAAGVAVAVGGLPRVERALVALVDEGPRRLVLLARRGGVAAELDAVALPTTAVAPYVLDVFAFDDRIRARVGETVVEADRGDLRDGQVALVLDGPGSCSALHVDGLDAYLTQLTTSRYPGFAEHVGSWDGTLSLLPGDAGAVPDLLAATAADLAAVMTPAADAQLRQRLFDRWVAELVVPLAPTVDGLRLHRVADATGARLLVLESPEPLPLSTDVALRVTHRVRSVVDPPPDLPRALLRFAADLTLGRDTVSGPVPDEFAATVGRARTLVHALPDRLTRLRYAVYRVRVGGPVGAVQLSGELAEVRTTPVPLPGSPPRPLRLPAGHIVLLDAAQEPMSEPLPLPTEHEITVPLSILTNSVEDRALLIPDGPLRADAYAFTFSIDRARLRTPVIDDTTRYQRSATLAVTID